MVFRLSFFDSGVGGLIFGSSIINNNLPLFNQLLSADCSVEIVYLCDNLNAPYHNKTFDQVLSIGNYNISVLAEQNSDLAFIACNTISSQEKHLTIPKSIQGSLHFLAKASGDFAVEVASNFVAKHRTDGANADSVTLSLWATDRTIKNNTYQDYIYSAWVKSGASVDLKIHTFAPPWSKYIQQDFETASNSNEILAKAELDSLLSSPQFPEKVDAVLLYCTHFPYYLPMINSLLNSRGINPLVVSQGTLFKRQLLEAVQLKLNNNIGATKGGLARASEPFIKVRVITTGAQMENTETMIRALHHCKIDSVAIEPMVLAEV